MIRSFGNDATQRVFEGLVVKEIPPRMQQRALAKLQMINAAGDLADLEAVKSNMLELLSGERNGKHCICVDLHGRICFRWVDGHAYDVEIFGYH
ncbi:MAG: type II toxin-antitoxin system RelE/ParE family toxin [Steroidobacteraceae bacterium]